MDIGIIHLIIICLFIFFQAILNVVQLQMNKAQTKINEGQVEVNKFQLELNKDYSNKLI